MGLERDSNLENYPYTGTTFCTQSERLPAHGRWSRRPRTCRLRLRFRVWAFLEHVDEEGVFFFFLGGGGGAFCSMTYCNCRGILLHNFQCNASKA